MILAMRLPVLLALVAAAVTPVTAWRAQSPIAFEVASVRPATRGAPRSERITETRLDLINTSLRRMLAIAFRADTHELSAPAWLNTANFDVNATFPAGSRARVPDTLRTLLAERFGLVTHVESRAIPAYELVVGKGLTMKEVEASDEVGKDFGGDSFTQSTNQVSETLDGPVRIMGIPLGMRRVTARSLYETWTTAQGTFIVNAIRMTMAELATVITANVDKPVVDKTGLTGVYQFKIELDANQSAIRGLRNSGISTNVRGEPIGLPTGVSTFKAIESLGLKLEERGSLFDVVVVDKIAQTPLEN